MVDVLYFAWVRERVGVSRETIDTGAATIGGFVEELKSRGERYELALEDIGAVRFAVDQTLASLDTPIGDAREIAVFPPMTGG